MSWWALICAELKAIWANKAIAITVFGGVFFYAILYPLPYLNNVATEQQIVVIDRDNSSLSRQVIRHANASPQIEVVAQLASINDGQEYLTRGQALGLVVIPQGFRRDLMLGKDVTLATLGDANYFLVYSAIAQGMVSVGLDTAKQMQFKALLAKGQDPGSAELSLNAIKLNSVPAFNPSLGYMSYVVPAVLLLVLQQTLLIGSGILGASQWRSSGYWNQVSVVKLVTARIITFAVLYLLFASFYFGWCHYYYQLPVTGELINVVMLLVAFVLASSAAGVALSSCFSRTDMPTQIVLLISMPILFASGLIWPTMLIPEPIVWLSQLIPAIPAMMAMAQVNQMSADWSMVFNLWLQLWGLFLLFSALAYVGVKQRLS
ncbi:ABC transporter permease [Shewanella maritima]|uniref:ABC transporter permease n=1 Tax=Shewanella maritima TaxID=2520507 RepID=A0A411PGP0_9GAMM|nr:ABC transporter permease [Shewanella maritima]QBF82766.1 ABC transporter permease [Shewanella maritima]